MESEEELFAFSECDDADDWHGIYTECDIYAEFPKYVGDFDSIGHELMHGLAGDFHK